MLEVVTTKSLKFGQNFDSFPILILKPIQGRVRYVRSPNVNYYNLRGKMWIDA